MSTHDTGPKALGVQALSEKSVMEKESLGCSRSRMPVSTWTAEGTTRGCVRNETFQHVQRPMAWQLAD